MAKLTENTPRTFEGIEDFNTVAVVAGVHIYQGELLGLNAGYARPYQVGDTILGFAHEEADNTKGENGDIKVDVRGRGKVVLELDGLTQESVYEQVLITANGDFSTESGDTYFGKVLRLEGGTHAVVAYDFIYLQEIAIASETTQE